MNSEEKRSDIAKREEEILAFWEQNSIFKKSLDQTAKGEPFVFYDGPPFATGLPHYGHILANVIKDAIPRYQTMRGRYVRRVWGWDCHGLPIENLIEKELGLKNKKDIEEYGIEKFNESARQSVLRYDTEWAKMVPRIGRWVDMDQAYKTMDASYSESIWWAFKNLYDKGLIYQNFKSMQVCPRCETTLSNNEVTGGYKDITDISVTAKFELVDEPSTFVLAWTTTPWTLPGNAALAVNPKEQYAEVSFENKKYIVAEARVEKTFSGKEHSILKTIKGSDLTGRAYQPIFDYYSKNETLENRENGWKIYGADFVTMVSGTGVVHIAPAFGDDDMNLGKREKLPFIQHVGMDGKMKSDVVDFPGVQAKPKDDHQSTDILIIKHLAKIERLFSKEKIIHAYPHCWRCDTPLLNYAAESWFVKVPELKDRIIEQNKTTSWTPENLRDGRFGNLLEGAPEWAISRARFWGAPIPVWNCTLCERREVFGSREELLSKTKKSKNRYIIMRHGEAESNAQGIVSSRLGVGPSYGLTETGKAEALKMAGELKKEKIDLIITSPFTRTKETTAIVAKDVGITAQNIITDDRIKEVDTGVFDGRPISEYREFFSTMQEKFTKSPDGGENVLHLKRRAMEFLDDLEEKYEGKTILIVTHEYVAWMLSAGTQGLNVNESIFLKGNDDDFIKTGTTLELPYAPFPHNADFEFDVHRPYIDNLNIICACGGKMKRVPYVFDCWFESGSMPYAQFHYPFENKELFEKNFPANFIAEGIDQTRGWFSALMTLSVGIFGKAPFQNVIVNGLVLAENGQKMSKKLKNYPDPWDILNKYGADAVRYYLLSSPVVHAEDLAFSERGVDEVVKKNIARVLNVLSFYELHGGIEESEKALSEKSTNPLDLWILARLSELGATMTTALNAYEIDRAVKPIALFVDDLSTWYLRRSRDRFKSEDQEDRMHTIVTTRMVLLEFSKLLAPIMPFLAEHVYREVKGRKESVHLESWPELEVIDLAVLRDMEEVRRIVSLALELRATAGIKVRQPLGKLTVKNEILKGKKPLITLVEDEVNVKDILFDNNIETEVSLDTAITPELQREGQFREMVRTVQELRKNTKLTPSDVVVLEVGTNDKGKALVSDFNTELKKLLRLSDIVVQEVSGEAVDIDGIPFALTIKR
ncbi:MAG: class I tRNA ligase family protein [Patescibacteria group bacterium]